MALVFLRRIKHDQTSANEWSWKACCLMSAVGLLNSSPVTWTATWSNTSIAGTKKNGNPAVLVIRHLLFLRITYDATQRAFKAHC